MDFDYDSSTISSILVLDPGINTLEILGNTGLSLPSGTTIERSLDTGAIRFNTDTNYFEGNIGTKWINFQAGNVSLDNLANIAGTGLITLTGPGTYSAVTITGTAGTIVVSNGSGVLGNPTRHFPIMSSVSYGNFLIQKAT